MTLSRRAALGGSALLFPGIALAADDAFASLEKSSGARIGVAAWDSGSGKIIHYRADERFIPCSSFKLSLAALVLQRADAGKERLNRVIHYPPPTLGVSPATTKNQATGMKVVDLCEAAVIYSDNTAANLLLDAVGGPAGVTAFWRSLGDKVSRLDDNEPALNQPDPIRNTATPAAMLGNLKVMLLGDALSNPSLARLLGWMHANTTGATTLKAGLPPDWKVGDKTGRNPAHGFVADLAIITPPHRKPILAVCYAAKGDDAVVASAGKIIAGRFA
ncbi:MAG: class A beta-lactamase [Alphaproteobacteria bacterium]